MRLSALFLACSLIWCDVVSASWQLLSRPDLQVPRLNITHPAQAGLTAPGYFFIAPFAGGSDQEKHGPLQPGPYIFDDQGQLVWSGFAQYFSIWTVNLQTTTYHGEPALLAFQGKHNAAHGHGHGHLKLLDAKYDVIREIRAGHHRLIDKHEGQVINDGKSALFQIYQPVPRDLSAYGGDEDHQWIVDGIFQEVDLDTGDVVFEWHSLEHVPPSHSNISLTSGQAGNGLGSSEAWDYFHINSVDKNDEGDYLLSARDVNSVYKIDGKTGRVLWRLGGRNQHNDFRHLDNEVAFSFQHHARYQGYDSQGRELISLYDNSAHGTETDTGSQLHDAPTSSGKILALDHKAKTVATVRAFYPPFKLLSKSQGSTHVLPGGNVVVNWGSEGAVTEFTSDGTVVFHAFLESGPLGVGVQNYRAFKNEWIGRPSEEAAVAGLVYGAEHRSYKVLLAASWNGDTEVSHWRFLGKDVEGNRIDLGGKVARVGFETRLTWVRAQGYNAKDELLTTTRWEPVDHERPVPPAFRRTKELSRMEEQQENDRLDGVASQTGSWIVFQKQG
ncbi:hypothetical protein BCV69DRAFT_288493 [Microstroma glucosiphilum]|uniref:Arylsulfotransferase n=1 Tax=Pseudomicrostroma glucosiphilum TaxID=1684307 RepID=A0A316U203_9BASI|nr:hypothetical protein BCV69DRAFT_288493 [Pseudomicrostroma glucosiphilum]PWN18511.1 hypothetical protein BCV69DRAFT_288493 [Pseudomicrostroma glucosiphilum]